MSRPLILCATAYPRNVWYKIYIYEYASICFFCLHTGAGDLTGYITAQPTSTATYTYIHDTAITGTVDNASLSFWSCLLRLASSICSHLHPAIAMILCSQNTLDSLPLTLCLLPVIGYSKWIAGQIGYAIDALGSFTVTALTGDNYTTISTASTPLSYTTVIDAPTSSPIGVGRYLRVIHSPFCNYITRLCTKCCPQVLLEY